MATGNDQILDRLGMAHLGSPKALLGKKGGRVLGEFREFAMRGSMLDMAVGIIVGAASRRVVNSCVSDSPDAPDWLAHRPQCFLEQIYQSLGTYLCHPRRTVSLPGCKRISPVPETMDRSRLTP